MKSQKPIRGQDDKSKQVPQDLKPHFKPETKELIIGGPEELELRRSRSGRFYLCNQVSREAIKVSRLQALRWMLQIWVPDEFRHDFLLNLQLIAGGSFGLFDETFY